jgi:hypothetical protein
VSKNNSITHSISKIKSLVFNSNETAKVALNIDSENSLTEEETKQILTPFAFKIDESLFGLPLAAPWRRGFALLVDLILVSILSDTPGELLALVVAITFFRLGSKKRVTTLGKTRSFKRGLLRFFGAFIIFVVLVDTLPELFNTQFLNNESGSGAGKVSEEGNSLSLVKGVALAAISTGAFQSISNSECKKLECWQVELFPMVEELSGLELTDKKIETLIEGLVAGVDEKENLSHDDKNMLEKTLFSHYQQSSSADLAGKQSNKVDDKPEIITLDNVNKDSLEQVNHKDDSGFYKGLDWFKGVINDLGLSFGWAAFYFTVLTAAWHGQTPGKRLFNIRVIQLDGTPLSVWDSFGRYGGYGAGLATGLLGFLQIYWDPNRQAIHDKISATVVIDMKKLEQMQQSE